MLCGFLERKRIVSRVGLVGLEKKTEGVEWMEMRKEKNQNTPRRQPGKSFAFIRPAPRIHTLHPTANVQTGSEYIIIIPELTSIASLFEAYLQAAPLPLPPPSSCSIILL